MIIVEESTLVNEGLGDKIYNYFYAASDSPMLASPLFCLQCLEPTPGLLLIHVSHSISCHHY